jgi:hypothetical protein
MRCVLNGDSTIGVSVNNPKRMDKMGIELTSGIVVKDKTFVTWLVIMVMAFLIGTAEVVINDNLSALL